ncbi:hypothetical protein AWE77_21485 [Escherichia coli]|nr:hypothetical protein AWE77_21485 [Escherichia coli]
MYYINTDCTYTNIALHHLLEDKFFDDKCCYNINVYDLRYLKIEEVACRLIQLFKERARVNVIFIYTDRFLHSRKKPRSVFLINSDESIKNWNAYIKKLRYSSSNLLMCFLFMCSLYHISVFTGKKQTIIACIKKGFSFSEIISFLNITSRVLINYIGMLAKQFFLPGSYAVYKYISNNIIASFSKEYYVLYETQRRYYVW